MAVSSPLLSSLSTLFSQERKRTTSKIQLKASLDSHSQSPSKTQLNIKRQNHLHAKIPHAKFSEDFSANQSSEVDIQVQNGQITEEEPWWYCLPCVLGILLSGGESESSPQGLYSLEIGPNSIHRNPMSYAITFEDRVDATNFCYVLDTFFEDLNDVSAEIIPFTIQELKEEVQSGRLNVVVIPKGKLKLFGSQTLEEVETELHSFLS